MTFPIRRDTNIPRRLLMVSMLLMAFRSSDSLVHFTSISSKESAVSRQSRCWSDRCHVTVMTATNHFHSSASQYSNNNGVGVSFRFQESLRKALIFILYLTGISAVQAVLTPTTNNRHMRSSKAPPSLAQTVSADSTTQQLRRFSRPHPKSQAKQVDNIIAFMSSTHDGFSNSGEESVRQWVLRIKQGRLTAAEKKAFLSDALSSRRHTLSSLRNKRETPTPSKQIQDTVNTSLQIQKTPSNETSVVQILLESSTMSSKNDLESKKKQEWIELARNADLTSRSSTLEKVSTDNSGAKPRKRRSSDFSTTKGLLLANEAGPVTLEEAKRQAWVKMVGKADFYGAYGSASGSKKKKWPTDLLALQPKISQVAKSKTSLEGSRTPAVAAKPRVLKEVVRETQAVRDKQLQRMTALSKQKIVTYLQSASETVAAASADGIAESITARASIVATSKNLDTTINIDTTNSDLNGQRVYWKNKLGITMGKELVSGASNVSFITKTQDKKIELPFSLDLAVQKLDDLDQNRQPPAKAPFEKLRSPNTITASDTELLIASLERPKTFVSTVADNMKELFSSSPSLKSRTIQTGLESAKQPPMPKLHARQVNDVEMKVLAKGKRPPSRLPGSPIRMPLPLGEEVTVDDGTQRLQTRERSSQTNAPSQDTRAKQWGVDISSLSKRSTAQKSP